jgi:serine/threonine protein kinase
MSSADTTRPRALLAAGATIGAYQVLAPLGAGAMGEVYRARDTRLGREVALKLLPASRTHDESARGLAEREARIVASLNHPNILALHDIGLQDGAMYLVTELIDGESLRGSTLTMRKSLDIAAQIADGLSAAHAAGVTHRDLKPDNVMVTRDGRVKLVDFGVAEVTPLPSDADATFSSEDVGVVAGTLGYMAPEQVRASEIDGRADIFSFGALLYELLSGKRAFSGETGADVITAILKADPPELPAGVPPLVREIVHRCLEKKREERFQSARDLAFAVRQAAAAIGVAPDTTGTVAGGAPSAAAVRGHLTKLLSSPRLVNAERLSSLLRFIVEETLNGRGSQLKKRELASTCLAAALIRTILQSTRSCEFRWDGYGPSSERITPVRARATSFESRFGRELHPDIRDPGHGRAASRTERPPCTASGRRPADRRVAHRQHERRCGERLLL